MADTNEDLKELFAHAAQVFANGEPLKAAKGIKNGQVFDENFLMTVATMGAFALGEYPEAGGLYLKDDQPCGRRISVPGSHG